MTQRMSYAVRFLLAAVAYGVAYAVLRDVSLESVSSFNWAPYAALRLSCLLLMPMRYWPALVIGELVPLGYDNALHRDQYGLMWAGLNSIPRTLEVMPVVWLVRRYLPDMHDAFVKRTLYLLTCMLVAALIPALFGLLSRSVRHVPPGEVRLSDGAFFVQVFMGHYLAMLAFTPLVLWVARYVRNARRDTDAARKTLLHFVQTGRWVAPFFLVMVETFLFSWGRQGGEYEGVAAWHWAMLGSFVPLIVAAWQYGWPGTALLGGTASLVVVGLMPARDDPTTLFTQTWLCVIMTVLFLFAAKTSMALQSLRDELAAEEQSRRLHMLVERRGLYSAVQLEDAMDGHQLAATRLMQRARQFLSAKELGEHYHALEARYAQCKRIILGLWPHDWWEIGDPDGPLFSALHAAGIGCDALPLPRNTQHIPLSADMQVTLQRMTGEAVLHAMARAPTDRVSVAIGAEQRNGRYAMTITVESTGMPHPLDEDTFQRLMVSLGALGLSEQDLRERARLYGGNATVTPLPAQRARVVIELVDAPQPEVV